MILRGELAEYLVMIEPEIYRLYVVTEKRKIVLYSQAQNGI